MFSLDSTVCLPLSPFSTPCRLIANLPEVFDVINKAMAIIVCKQLKTDVSEIPVEFKDLRLLRALPDLADVPSNDVLYARICAELMDCMQQLFAWVPLNECLSEFLLNSLFLLARWTMPEGPPSDVAAAAVTALSELFYRQTAIPHPHLIAHGIMQLLQEEQAIKATAPELYQDKLTELLRLFTTQHSSRWINDETFPNLLWHLYRFTFNSYGALAFTERLNIWVPIVKTLGGGGGFKNYTDLMMALLNGILEKMQFQHDQTEYLEVLDNSQLDDDMETEWQHFLTQCIEVVALIGEGRPEQVMEVIVGAWRVPFEVFFVVEKAVINGDWRLTCLEAKGGGHRTATDDASKCHYVHCILRDLSSLCQTFSRLAPLLEHCSDRISEQVRAVAVSLVLTVKFLATKRPHLMRGSSVLFSEEIQADFVETFAQTLSALRGLLPCAISLKIETHIASLVDLVAQVLLAGTGRGVAQREPQLVRLASGNLLLSITNVLRPADFTGTPGVKTLIQMGMELCAAGEDDKQVAVTFYKAVCNSLMLPWHGGENGVDQRYEERAKRLEEFLLHNLGAQMLGGCHDVVVVAAAGDSGVAHHLDGRFLAVLEVTLGSYRDILEHFVDATTTMKQMLVRPLKQVIEAVLEVFKLVPGMLATGGSATNAIFGFLFSCIQVVQLQLGNQYIKDMLGVLLNATLAGGAMGGGGQSVEKLLQILCLIVKSSHGSVQQVLLPSILELALDHIVPHLGQHEVGNKWAQETDITSAIFTLFDG